MPELIQSGRKNGYTVLTNTVLRDTRLRLQTKGLFAIMTSFPEGWSYSVAGLCSVTGAGKAAVRSCLDELQAAGYLIRRQEHHADGTFGAAVYVLYDDPADAPLSDYQTTAEDVANAPLPDYPPTDNPPAVHPSTGNPPQLNKDLSSKDIIPPYSPPTGDGEMREWFDRFWLAYPKKVGKQAAWKAWRKLRPDRATLQAMSRGLSIARQSHRWRKEGGAYIPDPATWINGRRWEDDPAAYPPEHSAAPAGPAGGPHIPRYVRTEVDPVTGRERDIYE